MMNMDQEIDEPLDYEDDEIDIRTYNHRDHLLLEKQVQEKNNRIAMYNTTFREMLLKDEILKAIKTAGFEHPSAVQAECIPEAILGRDVLCQAKSGMGKTAVFVLTTLQLLDFNTNDVCALIICHTRELAFQISKEYERFSKYMPLVRVSVFFGGFPIGKDEQNLVSVRPQIVVGTPGRITALVKKNKLKLNNLKLFIIDECDKIIEQLDMNRDVTTVYRKAAQDNKLQVMMFSATLSKKVMLKCKNFMKNPLEIYIKDEHTLTINGLIQHYIKVIEEGKNRKLFELLDALEYNQVIIFVKSVQRCTALADLLDENEFPASAIYRGMPQEERLKRYQEFKDFQTRILVSTDLFGRGIDIERVNIVFNFDMTDDSDTYLHRVARTGRFGTKGLAITFISDELDANALNDVQNRFGINVTELPDEIDIDSYVDSNR